MSVLDSLGRQDCQVGLQVRVETEPISEKQLWGLGTRRIGDKTHGGQPQMIPKRAVTSAVESTLKACSTCDRDFAARCPCWGTGMSACRGFESPAAPKARPWRALVVATGPGIGTREGALQKLVSRGSGPRAGIRGAALSRDTARASASFARALCHDAPRFKTLRP